MASHTWSLNMAKENWAVEMIRLKRSTEQQKDGG